MNQRNQEKEANIEDFNDFLLAEDKTNKDLGWFMAYKSIDIKNMKLDELALLKLKINQKKYQPDIGNSRYIIYYYTNRYKTIMSNKIDKRLKRFSSRAKMNSFYKAKKIIKELNDSSGINK